MLTSVEKYDILDEIGRGGMATVYRARDRRLQRLVALKVMHPHLQGAKEARARFAREALTIARLRHPGLLEIFDYSGEDSEISYIATELLEGPTLKVFMEEHAEVPAEIAACIGLQVAEALSAAHEAGVVHRDVKPENVMFHHGKVKLTDFGIAQLIDAQGMTTTGQVLGSPGHMAPEQIEGKDCSPRTDVFALGTVLYQLATGQPPFPGRNPHQILKLIIEGRVRDPLQLRGTVGATLARITVRCLATDPAQRFGSAEELAQELRLFIAEAGIERPAERLNQYLQDPAAVAAALRVEVIERQTVLGEKAQHQGRYPMALEHWNRVLALDPGNARVLMAVRQLGRRSRLRRLAAWVAAIAAAALLLVFGWQQWSALQGGHAEQLLAPVTLRGRALDESRAPKAEQATTQGSTSAGTARVKPSRGAEQTANGSVATSQRGASRPSVPSVQGQGGQTGDDQAAKTPAVVPAPIEARPPLDIHAPRKVMFSPTPANVSIAVDGQKPRPFGPSFRQVELTPGEHRFRFIGAHDCCVDEEITRTIEPGVDPMVLSHRLNFRPAGLYVVANTPANVVLDEGAVRGRALSVIDVPHQSMIENHVLRVSATGYRTVTRDVQLRSGQVKEIRVELERAEVEVQERDEG